MIALLIAAAVQLSFEDLNTILKNEPAVQLLKEMEGKTERWMQVPGGYQHYSCKLADQAEQAVYGLKKLKVKGYVYLEDQTVQQKVGSLNYTLTEKDQRELDLRILDMEQTQARYRSICYR